MPLEDFPQTLLVVSDMQFNPSNSYSYNPSRNILAEKTNYETAMAKLRSVFPQEFVDNFKIVWWYCTNRETTDIPSTMEDAGTYMFSGWDGAILSFLLGGEEIAVTTDGKKSMPTMEDIIKAAFEQEILALVN
jgi:hypothetical protein